MVKKGQKQTNYDHNLINLILDEYKACKSIKRLSDKYSIPKGTIKSHNGTIWKTKIKTMRYLQKKNTVIHYGDKRWIYG